MKIDCNLFRNHLSGSFILISINIYYFSKIDIIRLRSKAFFYNKKSKRVY